MEVERNINKALEKDRNLRYQSAAEIRSDLQRLKRDTDSGKAAAVTESASVSHKGRLQWVAAGAVGVIAAIVMVFLLWQSGHPSAAPQILQARGQRVELGLAPGWSGDGGGPPL